MGDECESNHCELCEYFVYINWSFDFTSWRLSGSTHSKCTNLMMKPESGHCTRSPILWTKWVDQFQRRQSSTWGPNNALMFVYLTTSLEKPRSDDDDGNGLQSGSYLSSNRWRSTKTRRAEPTKNSLSNHHHHLHLICTLYQFLSTVAVVCEALFDKKIKSPFLTTNTLNSANLPELFLCATIRLLPSNHNLDPMCGSYN